MDEVEIGGKGIPSLDGLDKTGGYKNCHKGDNPEGHPMLRNRPRYQIKRDGKQQQGDCDWYVRQNQYQPEGESTIFPAGFTTSEPVI
jgi:hypothetical protein